MIWAAASAVFGAGAFSGSGASAAPVASESVDAPALRIPAFTAYSEPDAENPDISEAHEITGWTDSRSQIVWYGRLASGGLIHIGVEISVPAGASSAVTLAISPQALHGEPAPLDGEPAPLRARVSSRDGRAVMADFGDVPIKAPGYYRFALHGVTRTGREFGSPEALVLSGPAARGAQFNLAERRNAASVHLWYPVPKAAAVTAFYNEVTAGTDPLWSYYMACGFSRGYFGIQVNSPTERRIIFSVWDSGQEPVDRSKVAAEDRVTLLARGENVLADSFGNEGTGGHSHLVHSWQVGKTYRFLVTAAPLGQQTVYTAYFYFPETRHWGLIASFRAPKDGGYLRGLYSFDEDFGGANGQKRRMAEFGSQWIRTADGAWHEVLDARFTHDDTGNVSRLDYGAGVDHGRFQLWTGGFTEGRGKADDTFHRPPSGHRPPRMTREEGF
jgi:hypothetical protein